MREFGNLITACGKHVVSMNLGIFLTLSRIENQYTFPVECIRAQWIQWTLSERLSTPAYNMSGNSLCLSRIENTLFKWNLFVPNGSNGLHRNDFNPRVQHEWEYFVSLTNRKYTFQLESIRVQWVQ